MLRLDGEWSAPIFGNGGSTFISKEKNGLYTDDEVKKKAVTMLSVLLVNYLA